MGWALPGMNELKDRKAKVRGHVMHGRLHSMVILLGALSDPRVGAGVPLVLCYITLSSRS